MAWGSPRLTGCPSSPAGFPRHPETAGHSAGAPDAPQPRMVGSACFAGPVRVGHLQGSARETCGRRCSFRRRGASADRQALGPRGQRRGAPFRAQPSVPGRRRPPERRPGVSGSRAQRRTPAPAARETRLLGFRGQRPRPEDRPTRRHGAGTSAPVPFPWTGRWAGSPNLPGGHGPGRRWGKCRGCQAAESGKAPSATGPEVASCPPGRC